jgi:hypothetical protein
MNGQNVLKNTIVVSMVMGDLNNIILDFSIPKGIATNYGCSFPFV